MNQRLATFAAAALAAAALAAVAPGCAEVEPSPRGRSPWRPVIIVNAVTPAVSVLQGEGGPIEVSVTNAGRVPVRAMDILPAAPVDDGGPFEAPEKGLRPSLEPGEVAKATAIVRPTEAGEGVVRRFEVSYADERPGSEGVRMRPIEVRLSVLPAADPIDDARSLARVGSQAPGIYSASLQRWGFERPDGLVAVAAGGEPVAWPGVALKAFAWSDLFVGDVPVKVANPEALDKLAAQFASLEKPENPEERAVPEGRLAEFFTQASAAGFQVEASLDGSRRVLLVK